jgi:transcriptional regulator with XRE-family HTH domain
MSTTWSAAISSYHGYYSEGDRVTSTLDMSAITALTSSVIVWTADIPEGTSVQVYAKLSGDTEWTECSNGAPVPVLTVGEDLSGKLLQVKTVLSTVDQNRSPRISLLVVKIRQLNDPRCLFGVRYGNISQYTQVYDQRSHKTVAYVAGVGQAERRQVVKAVQSGASRYREVFVDSRSISIWLQDNANTALLGSRLTSEMTSYGDSSADLALVLNLPSEVIDEWKAGGGVPEIEPGTAIASRYGVDVDWLYGVDAAVYSALYDEQAEQALTEARAVDSVEFEAIERQYRYRSDYDLGDFVTFVLGSADYRDLQITQIDEVYEAGAVRVVPRFGPSGRTLKDVIGMITTRIDALEGV